MKGLLRDARQENASPSWRREELPIECRLEVACCRRKVYNHYHPPVWMRGEPEIREWLLPPRRKPQRSIRLTRIAHHPLTRQNDTHAFLSQDVLYGLLWCGRVLFEEYKDATKHVVEAPTAGFRSQTPRGVNYCYSGIPFVRVAGTMGDFFAQSAGIPTIEVQFVLEDDSILIHHVDGVDTEDGLPLRWRERFDERLF